MLGLWTFVDVPVRVNYAIAVVILRLPRSLTGPLESLEHRNAWDIHLQVDLSTTVATQLGRWTLSTTVDFRCTDL